MPDTQWPRYYVFEQPAEGAAPIHAGSVHAPDAEMAILNARDVFSRRPQRLSMWLVRDIHIFSKTRAELTGFMAEQGARAADEKSAADEQEFYVFRKRGARGVCTFVGLVRARSNRAALRAALDRYPDSQATLWWIVAQQDLIRTRAEDTDELFRSASDKPFRHESHYPVRTLMREVRSQQKRAES